MTNLLIIGLSLFVLCIIWIALEMIFAPEYDEDERPIIKKRK